VGESLKMTNVMKDLSGVLDLVADRPTVIFLEVVGTLFGVRDGVGAQYAIVADRFGVTVDADALDVAFYAVFKQAGSPAFPDASPETIPQLEFDWWRSVVVETFQLAGVLDQFVEFDRFFDAVFQYFATDVPWVVYPETFMVLNGLQTIGIPLGVLSNFDSRIYAVLRSLKLYSYFQSVTISTEAGAAKPNPAIFHCAIAKHGCEASQAWHVGDSRTEDFEAAIAAGLRGIWVDR
jgi:putative hydrolase of the HAD superfamily